MQSTPRLALAALFPALLAAPAAMAFQIDTENPELRLSLNTVLKYSTGFRIDKPIDETYTRYGFTGFQNSGTRNFSDRSKPISNRLDLFSEFDLKYQRVGLRLSGAAFYDAVYMGTNSNPGGRRQPGDNVPYNEFTERTKELHGRDAELLDAFVFGSTALGSNGSANLRIGRHALQWGESLFFGGNAVAGAMSAVDLVKLLSVPNAQFKEAILPVEQISGSLVLGNSLSIEAYYQAKWRGVRLPGHGSYFSNLFIANSTTSAQVLPAQQGFVSGPSRPDLRPRDGGQYGVALKYSDADRGIDYGLYAINYHSKGPAGVFTFANIPAPASSYGQLLFNEDIQHYAGSLSFTRGDIGIGVELGYKRNAPLTSSVPIISVVPFAPIALPTLDKPVNAIGNTAHLNVTMTWTLPRNALADESMFMGELAWNRTLDVTQNRQWLDAKTTRHGSALQVFWVNSFRQVLPGLDISVPLGVGYGIDGRASATGSFATDKGGRVNLGVAGAYLNKYNFSLTWNHFFGRLGSGGSNPYDQHMKDRDFVSLSASTSF